MINTPLKLRWRRAKNLYINGAIRRIVRKNGAATALVHGSKPAPYSTQVYLDEWGAFHGGSCTCPDYIENFAYILDGYPFVSLAGMPLYRGKLVCKHMLGLSLKVYLELEAEVLQ